MTITIPGACPTKGSTRAFRSSTSRRIVTRPDCRTLTAWTRLVRLLLLEAGTVTIPSPAPVGVSIVVERPRPARSPYAYAAQRPDLDKHVRACLDALTGLAYDDDAQVTLLVAEKLYGPAHQTTITVQPRLDLRDLLAPHDAVR